MNKCGQCALKAIKGGMCPIFNANMEGKDGCPYYATELKTCDICGALILTGGFIEEDNGVFHQVCSECANGNPCKTCKFVHGCKFEQDQSCTEPPYVMVQHRQGNAVIQSQRLNPKRVQATCAQGCICYYAEGLETGEFCWRQLGCGCTKHQTNWRNG